MAKVEYLVEMPENGALYSFLPSEGLTKQLSDVGIGNGLAWNEQNTLFYYIDSLAFNIVEFSIDKSDRPPKIVFNKVAFDLKESEIGGFADGLTMDVEGKLWFVDSLNGKMIRVDPSTASIVDTVIELGIYGVTSLTFSGPAYDRFYITSAFHKGTSECDSNNGGKLLLVTELGTHGRNNQRFMLTPTPTTY